MTLKELSELSSKTVTELLTHTGLKQTVIPKTGRNSPPHVQIGRMDALAYCLTLEPPLVDFLPTPPNASSGSPGGTNTQYFLEVVNICRLDDSSTKTALRPNANISPTTITNLRLKALQLVGAAMKSKEWNTEFLKLVVEHFIRSLMSSQPEIVEAAEQGLRSMQVEETLPRDPLQQALRPLLDNLSEFRRLTVPLLRSFGRLLVLLPGCFSVDNLGNTLFTHLQEWLRVIGEEMLKSTPLWKVSESAKVAAAIIDVFPKLGDTAAQYMERMIDLIIASESRMGRQHISVFRKPLTRYLEQFPELAVDAFLKKLSTPTHPRIFQQLLKQDESVKLREVLMSQPDKLISLTFEQTDAHMGSARSVQQQISHAYLAFVGVGFIRAITERHPEWLLQNTNLVSRLQQLWLSPPFQTRLAHEELAPVTRVSEPKLLLKCLIDYTR